MTSLLVEVMIVGMVGYACISGRLEGQDARTRPCPLTWRQRGQVGALVRLGDRDGVHPSVLRTTGRSAGHHLEYQTHDGSPYHDPVPGSGAEVPCSPPPSSSHPRSAEDPR